MRDINLTSQRINDIFIAFRNDSSKIDPRLLKRKTKKGAKHAVNPVYIPSPGRVTPAEYRNKHMGKKKKVKR